MYNCYWVVSSDTCNILLFFVFLAIFLLAFGRCVGRDRRGLVEHVKIA